MKWRFLYRAFKARFRDEAAEISAARSFLRPGDIAVDVGANKGAYLYWLRNAVGATGRVFAYEPQPGLASYLSGVCTIMKWGNVSVRNCAVSNSAGVGTLCVPGQGDSPGASLESALLKEKPGRTYQCQLVTLDDQLLSERRIAFLKIDVEGHELQVFQGGSELLARDTPPILFECEARHLKHHSMTEVFYYLEKLGYLGQFFTPQGLRPLIEFAQALHQKQDSERFWDAPGYCNNFLFIHRKT